MTDRPILFSGPMVRALIDGRKTQTRRILKGAPTEPGWICYGAAGERKWVGPNGYPSMPCVMRFAKGDRLYVREAWAEVGSFDPGLLVTRADYPACVPGAYENVPPAEQIKWKPGIHMPRRASRLTLAVTDVRVERLQDISTADARAEGCRSFGPHPGDPHEGVPIGGPEDAYRHLWSEINGAGSWDTNPWIVAISFVVEQGNIDSPARTVQHGLSSQT